MDSDNVDVDRLERAQLYEHLDQVLRNDTTRFIYLLGSDLCVPSIGDVSAVHSTLAVGEISTPPPNLFFARDNTLCTLSAFHVPRPMMFVYATKGTLTLGSTPMTLTYLHQRGSDPNFTVSRRFESTPSISLEVEKGRA